MRSSKLIAAVFILAIPLTLSACGSKSRNEEYSSSALTSSSAELPKTEEHSVPEKTDPIGEPESTESSSTAEAPEYKENSPETRETTSTAGPEASNEAAAGNALADGMRPEFKEALDSYEEFFDEYCDFMNKFSESPGDLTLLGEYADYISKYSEMTEKMNELDNGDMNDAELKYYLEVTERINKKLLDTVQ